MANSREGVSAERWMTVVGLADNGSNFESRWPSYDADER
jgi:hypothetical protein